MDTSLISFEEITGLSGLDFDSVMEHLKRIANQEGVDTNNSAEMSKMLIVYFLQNYFQGVSYQDARDSITDGSNDQGIDAVFIEEQENGKNVINIIQSKLVLSKENFQDKRFSSNEVDKIIQKFRDYVVESKYRDQVNERLKEKIEQIDRTENKLYKIIFLTTAAKPPANDAVDRIKNTLSFYNTHEENVKFEFVGLGQLVSLLPELQEAPINFDLKMEGSVVDSQAGKARIVIGKVQASQVAELVTKEGQKLFSRNVRVYLKRNNPVNSEIIETATDPGLSNYFFIFNNGITIVCNKLSYMHGTPSPDIKILGGQIVNGGQTSNSIYIASQEKKLQNNTFVLVRIIETDESDVVSLVTKATNRQTSIKSPDLHSNDTVQKLLKSYILNKYGHYYEAKKNEFQGKQPAKLRIDKESAAQAFYAYSFSEPAIAKTSKSKLFGEYYDLIFTDRLRSSNTCYDEFFFSYQLLEDLKSISNDEEFIDYVWIRDALLTSLALMKKFSEINTFDKLKKDRENNLENLKKDYRKILKAIKLVVQEDYDEMGEDFEKRRFFITTSTLGRIYEKLDI